MQSYLQHCSSTENVEYLVIPPCMHFEFNYEDKHGFQKFTKVCWMFYILMLKNSQTREVNFDKKKITDENRHLYFKKCQFQWSAYVCGTNTLPYVTKYRNTTTISTSTLPLWPVSFSESQSSSNTSVSSLCLRPKIYYNGIVYLLTTT